MTRTLHNFLQMGMTALHWAGLQGLQGKEKLKVLLDNGADINAVDGVSLVKSMYEQRV